MRWYEDAIVPVGSAVSTMVTDIELPIYKFVATVFMGSAHYDQLIDEWTAGMDGELITMRQMLHRQTRRAYARLR